ncbi:MAG: PorV/PorQ family protein [Candidatus Eiseniibacteriota bacterium]
MKLFRDLGVAVASLCLTAGLAWGGTTARVGTSGASELRMPVGARSIALAGADLAMVSGAEAMFYNPAGIVATQNKTELVFSNTQMIDYMALNYIGVMQVLGNFGTIGVSAKVLSIGDIIQTTELAPEGTGATFSPTFSVLGLTYGKAMTDRVNFGGSLNYTSEKILQETAAGVAFDLGFQYDTGYRGARLGIALKSIGANMNYSGTDFEFITPIPGSDPQAAGRNVATQSADFELPTSLQFSVGVPLAQGVNSFNLYGAYNSNSFGRDEARFGGEWTLKKMFSLRGGYNYNGESSATYQYAYGLGVKVPMGGSHLNVDYAGQPVHGGYFNDVQSLSVGLTF